MEKMIRKEAVEIINKELDKSTKIIVKLFIDRGYNRNIINAILNNVSEIFRDFQIDEDAKESIPDILTDLLTGGKDSKIMKYLKE